MRPTNESITGAPIRAAAQAPQVGLNVNASPTQLAIDDTASRELDVLKEQLSTYNSGLRAQAQTQEELFKQREQLQAEMDFAADPSKFKADGHSSYYFLHGMDLMGEKAAVDFRAKHVARAQELLDKPENLLGVNIQDYVEQGLQEDLKGVTDPIVSRHIMKEAQAIREQQLPALMKAQKLAEDTKRKEDSYYVMNSRSDTPDNMRQYLLGNYATLESRVGKQAAAEITTNIITNKIATAQTADEAASWLAMFGTPVGGKDGVTGKPITVADMGGMALADNVAKLRKSVGVMKAEEQKLKDQAENERRKEALKEHKEAMTVAYGEMSAALDKETDPVRLGELAAHINSLGFDQVRGSILQRKIADAHGRIVTKQKADLQDPSTYINKFDEQLTKGGGEAAITYMTDVLKAFTSGATPPSVAMEVLGKMFNGIELIQTETLPNGQLAVPERLKALVGIAGALGDDRRFTGYMGEKAERYVRTLKDNMRANGGNLAAAMSATVDSMQNSKAKTPVSRDLIPDFDNDFVDDVVSNSWMPFKDDDVSDEFKRGLRQWYYKQIDDMDGNRVLSKKEVLEELKSRYSRDFIEMTEDFAWGRETEGIYTGGRSEYQTTDENGNKVKRAVNPTDLHAGWKLIKQAMEQTGADSVTIAPAGIDGEHIISYTMRGTKQQRRVSFEQLGNWTYDISREFAKDAPSITFKDVADAAWERQSVVPLAVTNSKSLNPVLSAFHLSKARSDVESDLVAVKNAVLGYSQDQAKQEAAQMASARAMATKPSATPQSKLSPLEMKLRQKEARRQP